MINIEVMWDKQDVLPHEQLRHVEKGMWVPQFIYCLRSREIISPEAECMSSRDGTKITIHIQDCCDLRPSMNTINLIGREADRLPFHYEHIIDLNSKRG